MRYGTEATQRNQSRWLWVLASLICSLAACSFSAQNAAAVPRLDQSFGVEGVATIEQNGLGPASEVVEASAGALVTVGPTGNDPCQTHFVGELLGSGQTDPSFGEGGLAVGPDCGGSPSALVALASGQFVVGSAKFENPCIEIWKIGSNGSPSAWAGGNPEGHVRLCAGPRQGMRGNRVKDLSSDSTGRILVAGFARWGSGKSAGLLYRLRPDGRRDTHFIGGKKTKSDQAGLVRIFPRGANHNFNDIAAARTLRGGKILVAGRWMGRAMVARLRSNGALDASFGINGIRVLKFGGAVGVNCPSVNGMIVDRHGRVVVAGTSCSGASGSDGPQHLTVARVNAMGAADKNFGNGGIARPNLGNAEITRSSGEIAIQKDGNIILSATRGARFTLVSLNPDGTRDAQFFDSGIFSPAYFDSYWSTANDVKIDHAGRIIAAGGGYDLHSGDDQVQLVRIIP
jgi:uncharacterized delta-60 repeat protein